MVKKNVGKLESLGPDASHTVAARVKDRAMSHLSRKISAYMTEHRVNASELADRAGLPRDSISRYRKKKSVPSEKSLQALAKAMGYKPSELMPNRADILVDPELATFEMVISPERPGKAWVRVDQLVDEEKALKIRALLRTDLDPTDGKRGR